MSRHLLYCCTVPEESEIKMQNPVFSKDDEAKLPSMKSSFSHQCPVGQTDRFALKAIIGTIWLYSSTMGIKRHRQL